MQMFYVKFEQLKKPGPTNVFAIVARDETHMQTIAVNIGTGFNVVGEPTTLSKHWK